LISLLPDTPLLLLLIETRAILKGAR